jgi:hypothetical protein
MDELLARGSLALPALVRARAAARMRGCAGAVQGAADALELWAGWAGLPEGHFGRGRGRG